MERVLLFNPSLLLILLCLQVWVAIYFLFWHLFSESGQYLLHEYLYLFGFDLVNGLNNKLTSNFMPSFFDAMYQKPVLFRVLLLSVYLMLYFTIFVFKMCLQTFNLLAFLFALFLLILVKRF